MKNIILVFLILLLAGVSTQAGEFGLSDTSLTHETPGNGAGLSNGSDGRMRGSVYPCSGFGTLDSLYAYIRVGNTTGITAQMVIYDATDSTVVDSTASIDISAVWADHYFLKAPVVEGATVSAQDYILAVVATGTDVESYNYDSTGSVRHYQYLTDGIIPSKFVPDETNSDKMQFMWATYHCGVEQTLSYHDLDSISVGIENDYSDDPDSTLTKLKFIWDDDPNPADPLGADSITSSFTDPDSIVITGLTANSTYYIWSILSNGCEPDTSDPINIVTDAGIFSANRGYRIYQDRLVIDSADGTHKKYYIGGEVSSLDRAFVYVGKTWWLQTPSDAGLNEPYAATKVFLSDVDSIDVEWSTEMWEDNDRYFTYTVVECLNEEFEVFRDSLVFTGQTEEYTPAIGATVDGDHCLAFTNGIRTTTTDARYEGWSFAAHVSTGDQTTVNLQRYHVPGEDVAGTLQWVVVEFDLTSDAIDTIYTDTCVVTDELDGAPLYVEHVGVAPGMQLFIEQKVSTDEGGAATNTAGFVYAIDTIAFYVQSLAYARTVRYHVVDWGDSAGSIQSDTIGDVGSNAWQGDTISISPGISLNRGWLTVNNNCSSTGAPRNGSRVMSFRENTHAFILQRYYDSYALEMSWQIIELPQWTIAGGEPSAVQTRRQKILRMSN